MKKTLSLLLFVVLAWPLSLFGELAGPVRSLRGVDSFTVVVVVENADEKDAGAGFDNEEYETAIELRLRSLGISVMNFPDGFIPLYSLYLNLIPLEVSARSGVYAIRVDLEFVQRVETVQNGEDVWATTWDSGSLMVVDESDMDFVKDSIRGYVDEFANDYLKANPPEPRSGQGGE